MRDVSMGEDASQVRRGAPPEVMAALRHRGVELVKVG